MLPAGTFGLSTPIVQTTSGVHLVGAGTGIPRDNTTPGHFLAVTRLVWIGAADATMIDVEPSATNVASLYSVDVRGIVFDCASLAAYCVKIAQASFSTFDFGVAEPRLVGAYFTTTSQTDAPGTQRNDIWVSSRSTDATYSPTGVLIDGGNGSSWNVSLNRFHQIDVWYYKGDGVVFGNSDNNVITDLHTYPNPSATGTPAIFAVPGYTMPNGLSIGASNNQAARTQRVLHVMSPVTVQGFSVASTLTAAGGNTGTVSFAAVSVSTSGTTASGTTSVVFTSTSALAAGMAVNCGGPASGIINNVAIGSIPSAGTVRLSYPTIASVAGSTSCSFSYGFTGTAKAGTYTITATGASTFSITAPSGGNSQTGIVASGGALAFTDLVLPISGSAVSGDTWTVTATQPATSINLEFLDTDNSQPTPHYMAGTSGFITKGTNMLPAQAAQAAGIAMLFSSEVCSGFLQNSPGTRAVQVGGCGGTAAGGATGTNATVINGTGNIASGTGSATMGGRNNTASGSFSSALGDGGTTSGNASFGVGVNYTDRSEATFTRSSGDISTAGDAQARQGVFYGRTTANSGRLTLRGTTPSAQNGFAIGTGTVYKITVFGVVCTETGNRANWAGWYMGQGILHRESGNAAYVGDYSSTTTPNQSGGTASTATLLLGADATFQTLSVTVADWPNGNNVDCTMDGSTVETH